MTTPLALLAAELRAIRPLLLEQQERLPVRCDLESAAMLDALLRRRSAAPPSSPVPDVPPVPAR